MKNILSLSGNLMRANAYAAIELNSVCPRVMLLDTMNEFRRNTQKSSVAVDRLEIMTPSPIKSFVSINPSTRSKFCVVGFTGARLDTWLNTDDGLVSAVRSTHQNGNSVMNNRISRAR